MRVDEYITALRKDHNIIVVVDQGKLKVKGSKENLTETLLQGIKQRKEEIIRFFSQATTRISTIQPVKEQPHYPISYAQRRLWILEQLIETPGVYNVPLVYTFPALDIEAFDKAFSGLLERHEIMRTTIHTVEGEPVQKVHDLSTFPISLLLTQK